MGRLIRTGLDYFSLDSALFKDIKIRKLIKYQGGKSVLVYLDLLCRIYGDRGYYILWDSELPFIISDDLGSGYDEGYVFEVIKTCISVGLFDEASYGQGVLTSAAIQVRYKKACEASKRKVTMDIYNLLIPINSEEIPINSEEIPINSEEIPINSEEMQQRKEKKRKENISPHPTDVGCDPLTISGNFADLYNSFPGKKKSIEEEYEDFSAKYGAQNVNFPLLIERAKTDKSDVYLQTWMFRQLGIKIRQQAFYDTLIPFIDRYDKEMLRDFYNYWSEPDRGKVPKMRMEKEKTWSVAGRLATWKKNEKKFGRWSSSGRRGSTISEAVHATVIPESNLAGRLDITKLLGQ